MKHRPPSKMEVNQYENFVLPRLNNNDKSYNTIEVQALYDRSRSVDPYKKKINKIPPSINSPGLNANNAKYNEYLEMKKANDEII